jgi:pyruvate,water dikinase
MPFIKWFKDLTIQDVATVGGKNASLGQMIAQLSNKEIKIPQGFAVTAQAYWHYLDHNKLKNKLQDCIAQLLNPDDLTTLKRIGNEIRTLIVRGSMSDELAQEIINAYHELSRMYGIDQCDVAVRSSATAEDLPTASFAGQQETYLNVRGDQELLEACKKCMASLFTDRAIIYRIEHGFDHFQVALSIGVQKMIRSDLASSGVAFSLDTETGFADVVMIDSSWGLGESIVKGLVIPDEFVIQKKLLEQGFQAIIKKQLGDKKIKIIYSKNGHAVEEVPTSEYEQTHFSLTNEEITLLARQVIIIENHYSQLNSRWCPMDIEWAKDGQDGTIYIVQARPETVHAGKKKNRIFKQYKIEKVDTAPLITGLSIGQQIVTGKARVIENIAHIDQVQEGEIIITQMTDPDWVPALKRVKGLITDRGGRTCHAAIVSRELGIPAIVGTEQATQLIKTGQEITLDCSQGVVGFVYDGKKEFEIIETKLEALQKPSVSILVNIADPDSAFTVCQLPVDGVGLARIEFIITNAIKIHPMALLKPEVIDDPQVQQTIDKLTAAYEHKKDFFIDTLAYGIGTIAGAFYPRPVIVRLSDFKTNEYRNLIGGTYFEPQEENPMLGFRGANRYYNERYKDAFALECAALVKAREVMGLRNIIVMVPFVRTTAEAKEVLDLMEDYGLEQTNELRIIMMCEIPANVVLIDDFCQLFDGISIGSNDLTQLVLGVDRDSALLAQEFDERNPAVLQMMKQAVEGAKRNKVYSGICGQAPSDYLEVARFLIDVGIESLSLNADAIIPFLLRFNSVKNRP